jgi:hypothetical protein
MDLGQNEEIGQQWRQLWENIGAPKHFVTLTP